MNTNTTTYHPAAVVENSWDALVDGQYTRIRRVLQPRGAHFEALKGTRWVRIDTMKAADAIAAAK